jgi:hypothetical protein
MIVRISLNFGLSAVFALALCAQTPQVLKPAITAVSNNLRNYAAQNPTNPKVLEFGTEKEIANQLYLPKPKSNVNRAQTAAVVASPASTMFNQTTSSTLPATTLKNFTGLGTGFNGTWTVQGILPPDTTMGVGLTQIVQWVNIKLTVLDKGTGNTAMGGAGYVDANQIWSGLGSGSVCATQNQGDPIVQYDRIANRWVLMQFAFTDGTATTSPFATYPAAPYAFCWAVSQTSDATGAYNLYQFNVSNLPDYPKLGIWSDAYYLTDNEYTYDPSTGDSSFSGTRYCAFDSAKMIAGATATAVCFTNLGSGTGDHFSALPADFEGTILPPAGETQFIINGDWFSLNSPPYSLQIRRFKPDFVTPANSTLNDGFGGAFDSFKSLPFGGNVKGACGDSGGECVPQPGTTRKLDTLSMRPMYRAAYRNLGANRETLVFTQSVQPQSGSAVAGIHLVEIRNPAANPPAIYNNVNFNPDSTNRWMGAAATDKNGNVGMGYSVSSGTISPGIRVTGRLRNDIRNSVRGEVNIQSGTGSQTFFVPRWGDYSTMQIDPSDDCTFWFTTEYMVNTSNADWATRISSFKFNNCTP